MNALSRHAGHQPESRKFLPQETGLDTYKTKRKLPEPTLCPGCGAVYRDGRWQWQELSVAYEALCPACRRQNDNIPAGLISLAGEFVSAHEAAIFEVVLKQEECEKVEHPLRRVMNIEKSPEGFLVTTTDIQLARDIGEALHHAFHGVLSFDYGARNNPLRVRWQR